MSLARNFLASSKERGDAMKRLISATTSASAICGCCEAVFNSWWMALIPSIYVVVRQGTFVYDSYDLLSQKAFLHHYRAVCIDGVDGSLTQKIFDNFFVVGDWTATGLPATIESAVKSSRLMADVLDVT